MITELRQLVGFRFKACCFSRSAHTLEFDGRLNDRNESLLVSTNHPLASGTSPRNDLYEDVSQTVWPLLE